MQEKLECSRCEQKWERQKARGRKPLFCPTCVELEAQEEKDQPKVIKSLKIIKEKESVRVYNFYIPGPSDWACDHCEQTLKVAVGVTDVPMHCCDKRRSLSFPFVQKTRQSDKEKKLLLNIV